MKEVFTRVSATSALWVIPLSLLAACSTSASVSAADASSAGDLATADLLVGAPDLSMSMTMPGTVTGTFAGATFGAVQTAWMIGSPDADTTTVVYLFNRRVDCNDPAIQFDQMGWDANLPDQTRFVELKLFGPSPATTPPTMKGDYKVTSSMTPGAGEASVNHSVSKAGGASAEVSAKSGTVTLAGIVAMTSATGSFTVKLGTDTIGGTFNAGYCGVGVEP